jgi:hypothetical protein
MEERRKRSPPFPQSEREIKATRLFRIERNREMMEIGRPASTLAPLE